MSSAYSFNDELLILDEMPNVAKTFFFNQLNLLNRLHDRFPLHIHQLTPELLFPILFLVFFPILYDISNPQFSRIFIQILLIKRHIEPSHRLKATRNFNLVEKM